MLAAIAATALAGAPCLGSPAAVLIANKAATSTSWRRKGTAISKYRYAGQGLVGVVETTVDAGTGSFIDHAVIGPTIGTNGFDGQIAWMRDISGRSTVQDGDNKPALAVNEAYRRADAWWTPGFGGAHLSMAGCNRVFVPPRGGEAFEASFDPTTHLLVAVTEMHSFGASVKRRFSDYRVLGGTKIPYRIETITNGDAEHAEVQTLDAIRMAPVRPTSDYSRPTDQPVDWKLPAAGRASVPFWLLDNHIVVEVKVAGRGPFPFIVDTGGHDIVTPSTALAIGLKPEGSAVAGGAGENTASSGFARIRTLNVGGAVLSGQTVVTLDFSPLAVEGLQLGGMLGVEFLERFVVTVDYGTMIMTLVDPDRFDASMRLGAGTAIPFRLYEHLPQISGRIDGLDAVFNIDTGARDDVTLTRPFVDANDLRDRYRGVTATSGWGVGGPSRSLVTRLGEVDLEGIRVERPLAALSAAKSGSFSDGNYDGNIGSGILKRYSVTFDYPHRVMYLRTLGSPDADVGRFDRTGMWINLIDGGVKVVDLTTDGPAKAAGLVEGDIITRLDGKPLAGAILSDVRRSIKLVPVGRGIPVEYSRDGQTGRTTLVPRNLVPE